MRHIVAQIADLLGFAQRKDIQSKHGKCSEGT